MIETRFRVESIEQAKEKVASLDGRLKGEYTFKDIVLAKQGECDLRNGFLRLRVYKKNNRPTKKAVLERKQTKFDGKGKTSKAVLRKEFDTEEDAIAYAREQVPGIERKFEYSRQGWEYEVRNSRVFVEDIEGLYPTAEVEAPDAETLKRLVDGIGAVEVLKETVPEIMGRKYRQ